jgi:hypothetical protein
MPQGGRDAGRRATLVDAKDIAAAIMEDSKEPGNEGTACMKRGGPVVGGCAEGVEEGE